MAMLTDPGLRDELDRVAAASGFALFISAAAIR